MAVMLFQYVLFIWSIKHKAQFLFLYIITQLSANNNYIDFFNIIIFLCNNAL